MRRRILLAGLLGGVMSGCIDFQSPDESETPANGTDDRFLASGPIDIRINDSPVDLSADRFQAEHNPDHDIRFHFHEDDNLWYMEEERVSFAQAIDLIPYFTYKHEADAHMITYDETTYDERESAAITFLVDAESVDPTAYDIQDGDHLVVDIETSASQ